MAAVCVPHTQVETWAHRQCCKVKKVLANLEQSKMGVKRT